VEAYFDEAVKSVSRGVYADQLRTYVPRTTPLRAYLSVVGPHKFARVDRLFLYMLTRAMDPEFVVETGVKWGESSLFILEALRRNDEGRSESGQLLSIDIGLDESDQYGYPSKADQTGFLVPEQYEDYWTLALGDSIEVLDSRLPHSLPVDLFYHDSLHTYDHMYGEFDALFPHMAEGGVLASEDVNENDAWDDFFAENDGTLEGDYRLFSLQGIEAGREIAAARVE